MKETKKVNDIDTLTVRYKAADNYGIGKRTDDVCFLLSSLK